MNNLLIFGAGQFGQVTKELAESLHIYNKVDFLDDNSELAIGKMSEYKNFINEYSNAIIAIGNPVVRKNLFNDINEHFNIINLISDKSYISPSAKIGKGIIVEPFSIINANTVIGDSTLICAGAIINHNSQIGSFCHINCGAIIKANSIVEDETKIDYGQVI